MVTPTETDWSCGDAPGTRMAIFPLYAPGTSPVGFTVTAMLPGSAPEVGVADSHVPPVNVIEKRAPAVLGVIYRTRSADSVAPSLKRNASGLGPTINDKAVPA